ncbi:MAG: response regulator [Acidobacteriota bacterium]
MPNPAAILYVDDENLSHLIFKAVFEDDYEVHTAISAREGLEILRRQPIDLLITDQCMPEMTGVELLQEIRDELPDIGRVILSAYSETDAIIEAINVGRVDHYVTKPWQAEDLKAVIDQVLEDVQHRARRRRRIDELQTELARERHWRETLQRHVTDEVAAEILASEAPEGSGS